MNAPKNDATSLLLPSGRTLTLTDGAEEDTVLVRAATGEVEIVLRFTDEGLKITASAARLSLRATEAIELRAPNIRLDADSSLQLHGAAEAEVTSLGALSVQGALVRIN